MKWTLSLSRYLTRLIFEECGKNNLIEWQAGEETAVQCIHALLLEDLQKEKDLEKEVAHLLDELETTRPGQFERYKMYPLLKKKLAQKKGVII